MEALSEHETFEKMLGRIPLAEGETIPDFAVVYFTARWCGACKRLSLPDIMLTPLPQGAKWYKCDVDENTYTAGYCGINSIPSFLVVARKQVLGQFTSSNTAAVCAWLAEMAAKYQSGSK